MSQTKEKDIAYKVKHVSFLGQLIETIDPALIGDNDYTQLVNFEYTDAAIKPINGMEQVSTVSSTHAILSCNKIGNLYAFQTYPITSLSGKTTFTALYICKNAIPPNIETSTTSQILSYTYASTTSYSTGDIAVYGSRTITNPPEYFLECVSSGTTGATSPNFDSCPVGSMIADGTVKWLKRKGDLKGTFTASPDNTIVFTDGYHNLIYGYDNHRLAKVFVTDPNVSEGSNIVTNGTFDTSDSWTFGTGWSWNATNKNAVHASGSAGTLTQTLSTVPGAYYKITFTLMWTSGTSVTLKLGSVTGKDYSSSGTFTEILASPSSSATLTFEASSDAVCTIDDVSVVKVTPGVSTDITDQVTTLNSSQQFVAILPVASDGNIYLDIGSPLKIRGINISVSNPNPYTDCTFAIYRKTITGLESGTVTSDTTYGLSTSGTITFSFSNTNDATTYYNGSILYWYRLKLNKGSHALPSNISIAYMSGQTIIQPIVDIWDGTVYSPIAFYVQGSSGFQDFTMAVVQAENQWTYVSGWLPLEGTYANLQGKTTYYIGSAFQLSGIDILFPTRSSDGFIFSNTTASTVQVYYNDGKDWKMVAYLVDLTTNTEGTVTHNQNGKIIWHTGDDERPTKLQSDNTYYFYKVVVSAPFSSYTYIDQIKTIPKSITLPRYKTCTIWNNRLVLGGNCDNPDLANEVLISASNSPYIWQGQDSMTLHIGDSEPITALATLFTRYGTDVQQTLVIAKEKSFYMTTGSTPKDTIVHTVSNTVGVKTQTCLATCDVGLNVTEGIYRSIVAILSPLGLFMFDNSSLISIDDVLNITTNNHTHGFILYDPLKDHVHFVWHTGSAVQEYVFDLHRKKWFKVSRAPYTPYSGFCDGTHTFMSCNNKLARINAGYTMIGTPYTCTFSKGVKPLEPTYYTLCDIRRARFGMSSCNETVTLTLNTELANATLSFTSNTTCSFYYLSSPQDLNLFGTVLKVSGVIAPSSSAPELYNLAILYKPVRIEM